MDKEQLIFDYLDNNCSESEKETVENLLITDAEFKTLFLELSAIHKLLEDNLVIEAPKSFTGRVMSQISPGLKFDFQFSEFSKWLAVITAVLSLIFSLQKLGYIPEEYQYFSSQILVLAIALALVFVIIETFMSLQGRKNMSI